MTKYKVKQSRLYDDLCHAILIMQALKNLDKTNPEYNKILDKKQDALALVLKEICYSIGTRKIILKCLNRLLELNNDNPEAKDLILTLFETIDEKPKKTIGSL